MRVAFVTQLGGSKSKLSTGRFRLMSLTHRILAIPAVIVMAIALSSCSAATRAEQSGSDSSDVAASAEPAEQAETVEAPVTVNVDVSAVTPEQASTCSAFALDEKIQRLIGDSTLSYLDSVSFGMARGFGCSYVNAAGGGVQIVRYEFSSEKFATGQLPAVQIQLDDVNDIDVSGSSQAFTGSTADMGFAYAQFGPAVLQINDRHNAGSGDPDTAAALIQSANQ